MKVREVIRLLEANGWRLDRMHGSHRQYKHPTNPNVVTVPGKESDDIPAGTLHNILRKIGNQGGTLMRYTVIIEKGEANYGAYAPDIPGCGTVADTREEVEQLIREAIEFHLEGLALAGQPIPQPMSEAITVEVSVPEKIPAQSAVADHVHTA